MQKTPEQEVADILPLEVDPVVARRVLAEVPFWFHTFALNRAEGIYTPGVAVDHRYRLPFLPASFAALRVLDVGTFDGFYAFVAEARGAKRVVAIDSEQHVEWVRARWGSEPEGGKGFRTIARLLGSHVEYRRLEASRLDELGETFDFVFCLGILHRVTDPLGLLHSCARASLTAAACSWRPTGSTTRMAAPLHPRSPTRRRLRRRRVRLLGLRRRRATPHRRAGRLHRVPTPRDPDHRRTPTHHRVAHTRHRRWS